MHPLQGDGKRELRIGKGTIPEGEMRFPDVLPGVYRARLRVAMPDAIELEQRVTILPDATAEVEFRR